MKQEIDEVLKETDGEWTTNSMAQLKKMEDEDEPAEKELELLMRKAVRESEQLKWEAVREVSIS